MKKTDDGRNRKDGKNKRSRGYSPSSCLIQTKGKMRVDTYK
jgi:hypothetical protein